MMIGPDPMTRTDLRSGRLGTGTLHQLAELSEQPGCVVRAGRGLRVVLDRERGRVTQSQALHDAVVKVYVRDLSRAEFGGERGAALPVTASTARHFHREAVIVAGDLHPAGAQVLDRLVHAPVAEAQLVGAQAQGPAENLAAETDPEHRPAGLNNLAHRLDRIRRSSPVPRT